MSALIAIAVLSLAMASPALITTWWVRRKRRQWEEIDAREQVGRLLDPRDRDLLGK